MTATHEIVGTASPADAKSYRLLPFHVAPGTQRVAVTYAYTDATGGRDSVLDIGIFDARGPDGRGFRGWSGGARASFVLTEQAATPGYTPGPLPSGTWHVLLGLYRISPGRCSYTVRVTLTPEAGEPLPFVPHPGTALDAAPTPRPEAPPGWLRGDLHCHTHCSDGDATPADVLATAHALGLDFLALTDHNVAHDPAPLRAITPPGLIVVPGVEVTTYHGHANVWGLPAHTFVEFRCHTAEEMQTALANAARGGAVVSLNHPKPHGPPWEYGPLPVFTGVEVWNGPWHGGNTHALASADAVLRTGRRIVFVGGSDMHHYHPPRIARLARPTTWLYAPGATTPAALLAALRAGHLFLSHAPHGPQVFLTSGDAMMGDTLRRPAGGHLPVRVRVRGAAGKTLHLVTEHGPAEARPIAADDETHDLTVALTTSWTLRAQVTETARTGPTDLLAITNPLFLAP